MPRPFFDQWMLNNLSMQDRSVTIHPPNFAWKGKFIYNSLTLNECFFIFLSQQFTQWQNRWFPKWLARRSRVKRKNYQIFGNGPIISIDAPILWKYKIFVLPCTTSDHVVIAYSVGYGWFYLNSFSEFQLLLLQSIRVLYVLKLTSAHFDRIGLPVSFPGLSLVGFCLHQQGQSGFQWPRILLEKMQCGIGKD